MGRKREGATLAAPLAGRKRRRPEQASGDWASLPRDIVQLVTDRLLDGGDVADYVHVRAVCSQWRASTESIDLTADSWIALCGSDAVRPDDAREIDLFHTCTARRLRVRLPMLRGYRIVCFSAGHLVLVHKISAKVRVLHPFTRIAVDFPSIVNVYYGLGRDRSLYRSMKAAVCSTTPSSKSMAVVVWFPDVPEVEVVVAEAGSRRWETLHQYLYVDDDHNTKRSDSTLVFQGKLYATMACNSEIVQLYPLIPEHSQLLLQPVADILNISGHGEGYQMFLVESGGKMLLVVQHHNGSATNGWQQPSFMLYEVGDLNTNDDDYDYAKLTPVSSLLDRALFLSNHGCLSVSALDLPSVRANSIYFSMPSHPLLVHSLATGLSEELGMQCQIHDMKDRIRPSVRPFTIADHLLTFCHPSEWANGLMFHEYHFIPKSFKELWKKIRAKERQLRM